MICSNCGGDIPSRMLKAQQGAQANCPLCGETTVVRYTIRDEMRDPIGSIVFRDFRYARRWLVVVGVVVIAGLILLAFLFCRE